MRILFALIALSLCTSAWGYTSPWDTQWKEYFDNPGPISIDWFDPDNWTNGVPGPDSSVRLTVFTDAHPLIGYGQAVADSISGGDGHLTITGGSLTTRYIEMFTGVIDQTGGRFTTEVLQLGGAHFRKISGDTIITSQLILYMGSSIQIMPHFATRLHTSYIHMKGADLVLIGDSYDTVMMGVNLVFNGGMSKISNVECAFSNIGATLAGFDKSYTLDSIKIDDGIVSLVDNEDNEVEPVQATPEAFYVRELEFASAGTIHTNGLDLYYLNGGDPKQFFWGDSNLDGEVGLSDLVTLATNYNQAGIWYDGDFNGDGIVSLADLTSLATNFGAETVVIEGAPIPEPATLSLLALGWMTLAKKRRR